MTGIHKGVLLQLLWLSTIGGSVVAGGVGSLGRYLVRGARDTGQLPRGILVKKGAEFLGDKWVVKQYPKLIDPASYRGQLPGKTQLVSSGWHLKPIKPIPGFPQLIRPPLNTQFSNKIVVSPGPSRTTSPAWWQEKQTMWRGAAGGFAKGTTTVGIATIGGYLRGAGGSVEHLAPQEGTPAVAEVLPATEALTPQEPAEKGEVVTGIPLESEEASWWEHYRAGRLPWQQWAPTAADLTDQEWRYLGQRAFAGRLRQHLGALSLLRSRRVGADLELPKKLRDAIQSGYRLQGYRLSRDSWQPHGELKSLEQRIKDEEMYINQNEKISYKKPFEEADMLHRKDALQRMRKERHQLQKKINDLSSKRDFVKRMEKSLSASSGSVE